MSVRTLHLTSAQHVRLLALARSLLVRALAKGEPTTELEELVDVLDVDRPVRFTTDMDTPPIASRKADRVHRLWVLGQDEAMQEANRR